MEARIAAVRRSLWLLLVVSALVALATLPRTENRTYIRALREMSAFERGFRREETEAKLLAQARVQGSQPARAIVAPKQKRGTPFTVSPDALPVAPLAQVDLGSLAKVADYAQGTPEIAIAMPVLAPVGSALGWRIARAAASRAVVTSARVVLAQVDAEDVARELEVASQAQASDQAERAAREASKKLEQAEALVEARQKRKMPWKAQSKARESRDEARVAAEEKASAASAAHEGYERVALAQLAPRAAASAAGLPTFAVLRVSAELDGALQELDVPVAIETRKVPVGALKGADFTELRQAGVWDEVKDHEASAAISALGDRLNWHMQRVTMLGINIPGALLLQALPCLLPALLIWLLSRIRLLAVSYSPFTTQVRSGLPRPGFKSRALEFLAVLGLPLLACTSASLALIVIDSTPLFPVSSAALCVLLGYRAFGKLEDLTEMVDSVVQSHSYPPTQ